MKFRYTSSQRPNTDLLYSRRHHLAPGAPHPLRFLCDAASLILRGSSHVAAARLRARRKDLKNQLPEINTLSEEQLMSNK
ncbi:hypothetical protein NQZ68_017475 [Dissostichus eleginoides]|nr:hypothetical protein NQZ68_017475 [Dissostichus eleginoides]